jgi:CheY-like chemotaxis protein
MSANLKKILVVDDDPVVGKSFERVLAGKNYAVITAGNGEEALKKLGSEEYDLVYTDIKMPGMSGIEVAERVKANRPWLPVVIITGYGTDENEARAEAAGVSAFLSKPLSPEMIMGTTEMTLAATPAEVAHAIEDAIAVPAAAPAAPAETAEHRGSKVKNVLLFLAAPFVGLAYLMAFPFVGMGMLAYIGWKAVMKNDTLRPIAMIVAAPVITLAFVTIGPIVGLGALAWIGGKAILKLERAK